MMKLVFSLTSMCVAAVIITANAGAIFSDDGIEERAVQQQRLVQLPDGAKDLLEQLNRRNPIQKVEESHGKIDLLRKSKCETISSCTIVGGSCNTKGKYCKGQIVAGCKGDCECCVKDLINICVPKNKGSSNAWNKLESAETAMKDTCSQGNKNVTQDMETKFLYIENKIQDMDNTTNTKLDSILENLGLTWPPSNTNTNATTTPASPT